jgi:hypothetical protein
MFTSQVARPGQGREVKLFRDHKELPEAGTDQVFEYVLRIKENAPFEAAHIFGISFYKYVMPSEASYTSNADKHIMQRFPLWGLTEKQAAAIMDRAKEVVKVIPSRTKERKTRESPVETEARHEVTLDKWLLIEKRSEFRIDQAPAQLELQAQNVVQESLKEAMYAEQAKTRPADNRPKK